MLLSFVILQAQDARELVSRLRTEASESCVTVDYFISAVVDEVKIEDEGTVTAQGEMWHLKGKSLEIYTNDKGTWILQPGSKEAVVEPGWTYDDLDAFYTSILKESGNACTIDVKSFKKTGMLSPASFTPILDDEWIVTDLR